MSNHVNVVAYTDGACIGNPGPGGWAVVIVDGDQSVEAYGCAKRTTNNRMELRAAMEAVRRTDPKRGLKLVTDSRYVIDGIEKWIQAWKRKGWRTGAGKPVKNREHWEKLDEMRQDREIEWIWVRGHAGDPGNERADALANHAARDQRSKEPPVEPGSGTAPGPQHSNGKDEQEALITGPAMDRAIALAQSTTTLCEAMRVDTEAMERAMRAMSKGDAATTVHVTQHIVRLTKRMRRITQCAEVLTGIEAGSTHETWMDEVARHHAGESTQKTEKCGRNEQVGHDDEKPGHTMHGGAQLNGTAAQVAVELKSMITGIGRRLPLAYQLVVMGDVKVGTKLAAQVRESAERVAVSLQQIEQSIAVSYAGSEPRQ